MELLQVVENQSLIIQQQARVIKELSCELEEIKTVCGLKTYATGEEANYERST